MDKSVCGCRCAKLPHNLVLQFLNWARYLGNPECENSIVGWVNRKINIERLKRSSVGVL